MSENGRHLPFIIILFVSNWSWFQNEQKHLPLSHPYPTHTTGRSFYNRHTHMYKFNSQVVEVRKEEWMKMKHSSKMAKIEFEANEAQAEQHIKPHWRMTRLYTHYHIYIHVMWMYRCVFVWMFICNNNNRPPFYQPPAKLIPYSIYVHSCINIRVIYTVHITVPSFHLLPQTLAKKNV